MIPADVHKCQHQLSFAACSGFTYALNKQEVNWKICPIGSCFAWFNLFSLLQVLEKQRFWRQTVDKIRRNRRHSWGLLCMNPVRVYWLGTFQTSWYLDSRILEYTANHFPLAREVEHNSGKNDNLKRVLPATVWVLAMAIIRSTGIGGGESGN